MNLFVIPQIQDVLESTFGGEVELTLGQMGSYVMTFADGSKLEVFLSGSNRGKVHQPRFAVGKDFIGKDIKDVVGLLGSRMILHFYFKSDTDIRFLALKTDEIPPGRFAWDQPNKTSRVVVSLTRIEVEACLRDIKVGRTDFFAFGGALDNLRDTIKKAAK